MIFNKKQTKNDQNQAHVSSKTSILTVAKDKVSSTVDKAKDKAQKTKKRIETLQLVLSLVGAIYFAVNSVVKVSKQWNDSKLFPFIIATTIIYIVVFVVFLLVHNSDSKAIKNDVKNFKSNMKFWKLLLNLLFIATSLLAFIDSLQALTIRSGLWTIISTFISGALLFVKLLSTLIKLAKTLKKRKKLRIKQQKEQAKLEKEQQKSPLRTNKNRLDMTHNFSLQDEPFTNIMSGNKKVEMRLNDSKRQAVQIGDVIIFVNETTGQTLSVKVLGKKTFDNFTTLYRNYDKTALGYLPTETARPTDMLRYYTEEQIATYGVCALEIQLIK